MGRFLYQKELEQLPLWLLAASALQKTPSQFISELQFTTPTEKYQQSTKMQIIATKTDS